MPTEKWFLILRTFEVVLNVIPEKSTKYTENEKYLIIFIGLRIFISKELDQWKICSPSEFNFKHSG